MAELTMSGVSKSFAGQRVLHPIDLTVPDGEFCCLLGSSGSGKSTLMRIIAGLEESDTGSVRIGERDVTSLAADRRRIGFVFQSYALFPHFDVLGNVMYGLRARRVGRAAAVSRATQMLELVGLKDHLERKPRQLSGGQQQRVALARALVVSPDLLLLDEPLSALDYRIRSDMQRELKRIQRETSVTTIMVTHDQEEAMDLADSMVVLDNGRVQQRGEPQNIYASPENDFVARFLGAQALGDGVVVPRPFGLGVAIRGQVLPVESDLAVGENVEVSIVAEQVEVVPRGTGGDGALGAVVTGVDYFGALTRLRLDCAGLVIPSLTLSQHAGDVAVGRAVDVIVRPSGVRVFAAASERDFA